MALVKKQWAEKGKSQIKKITIRYEEGTERTAESGLVITFAPDPEDGENEIITIESKDFTVMQWYMLACGLIEALYLNGLVFPMEDE